MTRTQCGVVSGLMAVLAAAMLWQCRRRAADGIRSDRGRVIFRNNPRPSDLWGGATEYSGVGA